MDVRRIVIVALYAGISSCGGGPADTSVSAETHPADDVAADAPSLAVPKEASVAPDGAAFATWDDREAVIVRVADGARIVVPGEPINLDWSSRYVTWSTEDAVHVVDRETFEQLTVPTEGNAGAVVARSADTVVTWSDAAGGAPGIVEVRRGLTAEPHVRIASASVSLPVVVDDEGKTVAWGEHSSPLWLHTIDVESGAHRRFRGQGAACEIVPETVDRIEGTVLRTEDTCHPGCPSLPYTPSYVEYDVSSGRVLLRYLGETQPPSLDLEVDEDP